MFTAKHYHNAVVGESTALYSCSSKPLKVPLLIVEGTHRPSLDPPRNAVEVESMIADAPRCCALVGVRDLVGLTLDARLIDMVLADGTVLHSDIFR